MKLEHAGNKKTQARYRQHRQVIKRGCFQVLERGLGMRVRVEGCFIAPLYCTQKPREPAGRAGFPGLGWLCEVAMVLLQQQEQ